METVDVPFVLVDVFSTRPLEGNPLSLVPDADDLDVTTMRRIAREFNQAESTFILANQGRGGLASSFFYTYWTRGIRGGP